MRSMTVLGTAIASLLLFTPLAVAQEVAEGAPDGCYIEWEEDVRVNLESLCNRPNPAANLPASPPSSSSAVGDAPESSAATSSPASITVRIISDVGSTVYTNGVPASIRGYTLQLPAAQAVDDFQPGYLQPSLPSRQYVSYQRFYPHPHLRGLWFGHFRRGFSPLPEVTTPPTRPYYLNPDVPIPRIEERQQQGIR